MDTLREGSRRVLEFIRARASSAAAARDTESRAAPLDS
jgi:hypothetical protein